MKPFSLHIRSSELALIPTPSSLQIEKDLVRESFIMNGVPIDGSSGYYLLFVVISSFSRVRQSIQQLVNSQKNGDEITGKVLQHICRTRIGEYCYNEMRRSFHSKNISKKVLLHL